MPIPNFNPLEFAETTKKALSYINSMVGGWPEDDWISIDDKWDLNLFYDTKKGRHCATLYPVVKGFTKTDSPYPLIS